VAYVFAVILPLILVAVKAVATLGLA